MSHLTVKYSQLHFKSSTLLTVVVLPVAASEYQNDAATRDMIHCFFSDQRRVILEVDQYLSNLQAVSNKSVFCLKTHEGLTHQFDFVIQQWKKDIGPGTQVILGNLKTILPPVNTFATAWISSLNANSAAVPLCFCCLTCSDDQWVSEVSWDQGCNLCHSLRLSQFPQTVWQPTFLHGWKLQKPLRTSKSSHVFILRINVVD